MIDFVEKISREAGEILLSHFGSLYCEDVTYKGFKDPVTRADEESQRYLITRIRERFAGDQIVAEEEGGSSEGEGAVWYIDPLDGTTNFLHRFPFFSVSVARARSGLLELAVVHNPVSGDTFCAEKGAGAFRNGERMRVSPTAEPLRSLIATGFACVRSSRVPDTVAFFDRFVREVEGIRRPGSAALDLAYTADGVFEGFYELNLNPWDLAAGILLVREAGGVATDFIGGQAMFSRKEIVAGNRAIHSYLTERIGEIARELGWSLE